MLVLNHILDEDLLDDDDTILADYNLDENIDILDVLQIITLILNENLCFINKYSTKTKSFI